MLYRCIALTSEVDEEDNISFDFQFEGEDGSSLMVVGGQVVYELKKSYELVLVPQKETPDAES